MRNKELKRIAALLGICVVGNSLMPMSSLAYMEINSKEDSNRVCIDEVKTTGAALELTDRKQETTGAALEVIDMITQNKFEKQEPQITTQAILSARSKMIVKNIPWDGISIQEVTANEQGIYEIYNAAQLAWISKTMNETWYGVKVKIMDDIDLGGKNWESPNVENLILDGSNHKISNFKCIDINEEGYAGLLGEARNTIIKNLSIENVSINIKTIESEYADSIDNIYIGGIVGFLSEGEIENCKVTGEVICIDNRSNIHCGCSMGGIAGFLSESNINNCHSSIVEEYISEIESDRYLGIGGVVGYASELDAVSIQDITSEVDILIKNNKFYPSSCGGIFGELSSDKLSINNLEAKGKIKYIPLGEGKTESISSGGIIGIGFLKETEINECKSNIIIEAPRSAVGGIIGAVGGSPSEGRQVILKGCQVEGELKGRFVGGILTDANAEIYNCSNTASIDGERVGGIISSAAHECIIEDCYNGGKIRGIIAGGIIGGGVLEGKRLLNSGLIKGKQIGGIVGDAYVVDLKDCFNKGNLEREVYDGEDIYYIDPSKISLASGGLIGDIGRYTYVKDKPISIKHSYNSGKYISTNQDQLQVGGLIGCLPDKVETNDRDQVVQDYKNNYFLTQDSNWIEAVGDGKKLTELQCKPLTFTEMIQSSFFEGWDFEKTWKIDPNKNDGMPYLRTLENQMEGNTRPHTEVVTECELLELGETQIKMGDTMTFEATVKGQPQEVFLQFSNPQNNNEWFSLENCEIQFTMTNEGDGHYTMSRQINTLGTRRVRVVYKDESGKIKYGEDYQMFEVIDLDKDGAKVKGGINPEKGRANEQYSCIVYSDKVLEEIGIQMDNPLQGGDWISLSNVIDIDVNTQKEMPIEAREKVYKYYYTLSNHPIYTPGNEEEDYKRRYRLVYKVKGDSTWYASDTQEITINPSSVTEELKPIQNKLYQAEPFGMHIKFETHPKDVKCNIIGGKTVDMIYNPQTGYYVYENLNLPKGNYKAYVSYTESDNKKSQTTEVPIQVLSGRPARLENATNQYTVYWSKELNLEGIIKSSSKIRSVEIGLMEEGKREEETINLKHISIENYPTKVEQYDLSIDKDMIIYTNDSVFKKAGNYKLIIKVDNEGIGLHEVGQFNVKLLDYKEYLNYKGKNLKLIYGDGDNENSVNKNIELPMGKIGDYGVEWRSCCTDVLTIEGNQAKRQSGIKNEQEVTLKAIPYLYKDGKPIYGDEVTFTVNVKKDKVIEDIILTDETDESAEEEDIVTVEDKKNLEKKKEFVHFEQNTLGTIKDMIYSQENNYMTQGSYLQFADCVLTEEGNFNWKQTTGNSINNLVGTLGAGVEKLLKYGFTKGFLKTPYDGLQDVFCDLNNIREESVSISDKVLLMDILSLEELDLEVKGMLKQSAQAANKLLSGLSLAGSVFETTLGAKRAAYFVEQLQRINEEEMERFEKIANYTKDKKLKEELRELIEARKKENYIKEKCERFGEELKKGAGEMGISMVGGTVVVASSAAPAVMEMLFNSTTTLEYNNNVATLSILRKATIEELQCLIRIYDYNYANVTNIDYLLEKQKEIQEMFGLLLDIDQLGIKYTTEYVIEYATDGAETSLRGNATEEQYPWVYPETYGNYNMDQINNMNKEKYTRFMEIKEQIKTNPKSITKYRTTLADMGVDECIMNIIELNNIYQDKLNKYKTEIK